MNPTCKHCGHTAYQHTIMGCVATANDIDEDNFTEPVTIQVPCNCMVKGPGDIP